MSKKWITAIDERVCQFCADMDGQTVGVSEKYWEKGDEMAGSEGGTLSFGFDDVSSPPLHPSCRCDLIPIFSDEKSILSFKKKNKKNIDSIRNIAETKKVASELEDREKEIEKHRVAIEEKEKEIEAMKVTLENQNQESEKKTKRELKKYELLQKELEEKIKEVEELKDSI